MARSKVQIQKNLFDFIDAHCARSLDPVSNAATERWIDCTADTNFAFMTRSSLSEATSFSAAKHLARYDLDGRSYFCAIGFDYLTTHPSGLSNWLPSVSESIYLISTLKPRPKANTTVIRSWLEVGDNTKPAYVGHDPQLIYELFPTIKLFEGGNISPDENWRIYFEICVNDSISSESWISSDLAAALNALCASGITQIPFKMICRSALDSDPTSMFMALYRSLEHLFAYGSMKDIIDDLSINTAWGDLLTSIESRTSWRHNEELSLQSLIVQADAAHVSLMAPYLSIPTAGRTSEDIAKSVGTKIYKIRNSIVHYRAIHTGEKLESYNWNKLCEGLTLVAIDVYKTAFP